MTVRAIHQVLPALHVADASGAHTLYARDALRESGFDSEVFVGQVDPPLEREALPFDELDRAAPKGETVLLYQLAVGSVLVDRLMRRHEPLLVNYHNLTPADFFWKWAPEWLAGVETGRQQLRRLAPRVAHAIAVSAFNERDLQAAAYRSTSVVPPFVDVRALDTTAAVTQDRARRGTGNGVGPNGGARWLFVGKLLPHKAAHDLIKGLACYRRAYDPRATLVLVGDQPVEVYAHALSAYADMLGIAEAVEFAGTVSQEALAAAYTTSDVFVCLSDHEGFCFPLLEAMHHGLPIVAFDAAAVGDTLGPAGLLLRDKRPETVAAAAHRVLGDEGLRGRLVIEGRRRLASFDLSTTKKGFVQAVRRAIGQL